MKNSSDTIGNRTRDLPTCSAVPQPTAPPRTPLYIYIYMLHLFCQSTMNNHGPTVYFSIWSATVLHPIRPATVTDQLPHPQTVTYINSYRILGYGDKKSGSNYGRFGGTHCFHNLHILPPLFSFHVTFQRTMKLLTM